MSLEWEVTYHRNSVTNDSDDIEIHVKWNENELFYNRFNRFKWFSSVCFAADPLVSGDLNVTSDVSDHVNEMKDRLKPISESTNHLKAIFVVLALWVGIVTVALAAFICVSYRRRSENQNEKADEEDVESVDYGSVTERIEDLVGASETDDYEA